MSKHKKELLIIGAGPFGLAVAAQASHLGIDHVVALPAVSAKLSCKAIRQDLQD